jgi:hypothetical protein
MSSDASNSRSTSQFEPLTFDASAAPGAASCTKCGTQLRGSYHMVDESMTCAKCRYAAEAQSAGGTGAGALLRAIGFGTGAAIVGAVGYYAFVKITDIEWALLTALVGIGVGMAVRVGSRGHGGRKYQIVALVLTYFAMAGAYLPFIAAGANEARKTSHPTATSAPAARAAKPGADAAAEPAPAEDGAAEGGTPAADEGTATATPATSSHKMPVGTAFAILAGVLALGLLTTPVFVAFASPISGLFIAYALYRAWKSNAGGLRPVTASGPFRLQQSPDSGASPA